MFQRKLGIGQSFLPDDDKISVENVYKLYGIKGADIVICAALNYGSRMAIPLKGNKKKRTIKNSYGQCRNSL